MAMTTDPVCGMRFDTEDAAASTEHEGETYFFCSQTCHDSFTADPTAYTTTSEHGLGEEEQDRSRPAHDEHRPSGSARHALPTTHPPGGAATHSDHSGHAEGYARHADAHDAHAGHDAHDKHPGNGAHDKHAGHSVAMFRDRFWLSVLLTAPILFWSETVQDWLGYAAPSFPLADRIPAIFGLIVFAYGGAPFLKGGVAEVRDRAPGMMLLISLAIVVAFVSSLASEVGLLDLEFWWELALLIDVMLLGHWQEMKALGQASGALEALAALLPDEAEVLDRSGPRVVPVSDLRAGDLVLVRSGARVSADGTIEEGTAEFDESMITGESKPVRRGPGDTVVAVTVATDSSVRVRVTAVGEETALAGIQRLVAQAPSLAGEVRAAFAALETRFTEQAADAEALALDALSRGNRTKALRALRVVVDCEQAESSIVQLHERRTLRHLLLRYF